MSLNDYLAFDFWIKVSCIAVGVISIGVIFVQYLWERHRHSSRRNKH